MNVLNQYSAIKLIYPFLIIIMYCHASINYKKRIPILLAV